MLTKFPFNSLVPDLKKEIFDHLDDGDSMRLQKVNRQLRSFLFFYGPFPKRINRIQITLHNPRKDESRQELQVDFFQIQLTKIIFPSFKWIEFKSERHLNPVFTIFKAKGHFCKELIIEKLWEFETELPKGVSEKGDLCDFLKGIDSIKDLRFNYMPTSSIDLLFRDFSPIIGNSLSIQTSQSIRNPPKFLALAMERSLRDCQKFIFHSSFQPLHHGLIKTNLRMLICLDYLAKIEMIEYLLAKGIPSQYPKAVVVFETRIDPDSLPKIKKLADDSPFLLSRFSPQRQNALCEEVFHEMRHKNGRILERSLYELSGSDERIWILMKVIEEYGKGFKSTKQLLFMQSFSR